LKNDRAARYKGKEGLGFGKKKFVRGTSMGEPAKADFCLTAEEVETHYKGGVDWCRVCPREIRKKKR